MWNQWKVSQITIRKRNELISNVLTNFTVPKPWKVDRFLITIFIIVFYRIIIWHIIHRRQQELCINFSGKKPQHFEQWNLRPDKLKGRRSTKHQGWLGIAQEENPWRAQERREFTKAAQKGPHYDIKQDLISESDLMRWLSWPINQAGFWPHCNRAHLFPP